MFYYYFISIFYWLNRVIFVRKVIFDSFDVLCCMFLLQLCFGRASTIQTRPACVWFFVAVIVWLILLLGFLLGLRDMLKLLSKVPECELGGPALCWLSLAVRRAQKEWVGLSELWCKLGRVWEGKAAWDCAMESSPAAAYTELSSG